MPNPFTLTLPSERSALSPTIASISLPALAHNLGEVQRLLPPRCEILAVVKADGYGHGGLMVAETFSRLGIRRFGVTTVQEGVALREHGIREPILVMGGVLPFQLSDLIQSTLIPVLHDEDTAQGLAEALRGRVPPYPVHIKVDTGMRRLGLPPEKTLSFVQSPLFNGRLQLEGLMTHLADADNLDPDFTLAQIKQFQAVADQLRSAGIPIPLLHVANTAGILFHPETHLGLVRPGIMLYGYSPTGVKPHTARLQPAMRLFTKVIQVRSVGVGDRLSYQGAFRTTRASRIAVLPIGYAHGYSRRLSDRGMVLVRNCRVPIVGNICMDMMLIDVTDLPQVQPGDEAVLMGKQGSEEISAQDLAGWQDSIPYEVLCSIGPRVHRIYEPLP